MPTQPAILGTMRLGNFRLGYIPAALAALRRTKVTLLLAGLDARIRISGLTIHDVINAAPSTCSLVVDDANPPTTEQALRVTVGTAPQTLLFAGALQTTDQTYEGLTSQRAWPCTAIDTTARFNRRRPYGTWVNVSATVIAQALALFAPAFGTTHIEAGLPIVPSFICDGSEDLIGAFARLATAIGGYTRVDDLDVYLFREDTDAAPDPIDLAHPPLDDPPITCSVDVSQLRTSVAGRGHGEALLCDVLAGETILPIADAVMFGTVSAGGRALAGTTPDGAQSQQIAYTGVRPGGAGSLVGPGAAPSVAPTLTLASGSGLGTGTYQYAYTDATAAGESLPSPLATVITGFLANPAFGPTLAVVLASSGLAPGFYGYAYSDVTAIGESLPSPLASISTAVGSAAPGWSSNNSNQDGSGVPGDTFEYFTTYTKAASFSYDFSTEFGYSQVTGPKTIVAGSFYPPHIQTPILAVTASSDPGVTGIRVWARKNGGAFYLTVAGQFLPNTTASVLVDCRLYDPGAGAPHAPPATPQFGQVLVSAIAIGPSGVTARKVYRTVAGGSQLKLLTTIADNVTTTYTDSTADGSLGANAPTTNTATANQVTMTAIALGPAGTLNRNIYRTLVNGSQLKYLGTVTGNATTIGGTDTTPDATIAGNSNAPTSDTSGLTQPSGQVNAGSIALLMASAGPFPPSGWAINGQQLVRYTGITGNTLTGIPSTGPGAILTTILYGSQVLPAPALIGVTGLTLAPAPAVPTMTVAAGSGLGIGLYAYAYTNQSAAGESLPSPLALVTTTSGQQQVAMTAIALGPAGTLNRNIYRTLVNGSQLKYLGTVTGNATTIGGTDTTPDATIAGNSNAPTSDTSGLRAILSMRQGTPVSIWVQRDDLAAQAEQAAIDTANGITPADGIYEGPPIVDERRGEASLIALCDANLQLFSRPIITFTYACRDLKTKSGKTVHIDIPGYPAGDYVIQEVTITEIDVSPGVPPRFSVTASTVRFSLDDILRRLVTAQAA